MISLTEMALIKIARKWERSVASLRKKRISWQITPGEADHENRKGLVADKGHFVVYMVDQRRFVFPIKCLNNCIFKELLRMSEEEFGLPREGSITLTCDAAFMEYVVSLIQRPIHKDVEQALLLSIAPSSKCCSVPCFSHQTQMIQHLLVC